MECNKEEALRAKEIAEKKMEAKDFTSALKIASKAHKLYPDLDNIEQMILVCDVHCSSANKICGDENDWYSILKVDPTANGETIKKQYRKFALLLHPDKNKFPGASDAFRMIGEAQKVLLDYDKRALHDKKRGALGKSQNRHVNTRYTSVFTPQSMSQAHQQPKKMAQMTFWTVCSRCSVKYQYYMEMKGKLLMCQQCQIYFVASEINAPGSTTRTNMNQQIPLKQNDTNAVKISPQTVPVNVNLAAKTGVQGRSVKLAEKGKTGLAEKGKTGMKECAYSKSEQSSRRSTRSRQRVSYSDDLNDEDELMNSSKRSKTVGSSSPSEDESSVIEPGTAFEYPAPDLNDFDKDRREQCFTEGQIWALYDVLDAMPRFYAVINKIFLPGFKSQVTWLEPDSGNDDEMKWLHKGLPASCGKFRLGSSEIIRDLPMFSHMVCWEKDQSQDTYKIYPKRGETWAIFENWDINWHSHIASKTKFVEVLSDYNDFSGGGYVAPLVKVKGFVSLFQHNEEGEKIWIPVKELFRFSHRVPCFKMTGTEGEDVPKGSFELDPASLPISRRVKGPSSD